MNLRILEEAAAEFADAIGRFHLKTELLHLCANQSMLKN